MPSLNLLWFSYKGCNLHALESQIFNKIAFCLSSSSGLNLVTMTCTAVVVRASPICSAPCVLHQCTVVFAWAMPRIQGVQKKMRRSFCLISLATNMLESWHIIHWKGGIHSFVWSTKTFLYDI